MDFSNLSFGWLPWVLALAAIGCFTIIGALCFGLYWIVSHLQWVW